MNIWSVFVTGLFAGGASCAAVQGGLLAGAVARRQQGGRPGETGPEVDTAATADPEPDAAQGAVGVIAGPKVRTTLGEDAVPVAGFLAGKLVSHTLFGALLGLFGAALQPNFRVRPICRSAPGSS